MTEISSLSRERNAHERERENKRSKTKRTTTHSDMIAFFLSSLLGFCNTSLCPYVFISHSTRCYDVRVGNFSCKNLSISPSPFSLSLSDSQKFVSLPLCKKKKRNALFVIFSLLFTVFLWIMNTQDTLIQKSFWREWTMIARRRKRTVMRIAPRL